MSLLKLRNISKMFYGVQVLHEINLELRAGEVHALVGENGAGKSTLVNIIAGVHELTSGEIYVENRKVHIKSPYHAKKLGISIVYQEPCLIPDMTIAENIFIGAQPSFLGVFSNYMNMKKKSRELLKSLGSHLHPAALVRYLSPADRYLVAIAQAVAHKPKILIMDEPGDYLNDHERSHLFRLIKSLKEQGIAILYITHRLKEIADLCDRITVLRDGRHVITCKVHGLSERDMVRLMLGRELHTLFPPVNEVLGKELLRIERLSKEPWFHHVSFKLHEGEILGLTGLVGSGQTELASTIFGETKKDFGVIYCKNIEFDAANPHQAVKKHFGYVHENRIESGLLMDMSVSSNLSISSWNRLSRRHFMYKDDERDLAIDKVMELDIKIHHVDQEVKYLSGGNQQKVMLGRWLAADSEIYLLDEPTRGMDMGSKAELYVLIHELVKKGKGVVLISSDLQELLGLCTRILVMHHGKVAGELPRHEATEEKILNLMQ
ncbi:sugar ABC transporter ATP-binding protein [Paenibacillus validus]|uniref:sugar ABC transporter ATP-binding protein n=1 Tax=Paenibacillus validus TaxID=44253 RepID=UPI003D2DA69D